MPASGVHSGLGAWPFDPRRWHNVLLRAPVRGVHCGDTGRNTGSWLTAPLQEERRHKGRTCEGRDEVCRRWNLHSPVRGCTLHDTYVPCARGESSQRACGMSMLPPTRAQQEAQDAHQLAAHGRWPSSADAPSPLTGHLATAPLRFSAALRVFAWPSPCARCSALSTSSRSLIPSSACSQ